MKRFYCTYFDKAYLTRALALIESLNTHENNEFVLFCVCMDEISRIVLHELDIPNVIIIPFHSIEQNDFELLGSKNGRTLIEYYWTATPTIILRILENNSEVDFLTYLDADLFFFSSPDAIFNEASGYSVFIHGHNFSNDLIHLSETCGKFNVGLIGFRRDSISFTVLRWWREKCIEWCFLRFEKGRMGDQKYLDYWPDNFSSVKVSENPGIGLAPWNYGQYYYSFDDQNQLTVNHSPVIFFHYSAFSIIASNVFVPLVHKHYPISKELIQNIYIPYCNSLKDNIKRIFSVLPEFIFGIDKSLDITKHNFISYLETPDAASPRQIKYKRQLDKDWVFYIEGVCQNSTSKILGPLLKPEQSLEDYLENNEISSQIKVSYFVGCHLFQEESWFNKTFTNLEQLFLFEPVPALWEALNSKMAADSRVQVFRLAVSDEEGIAAFNIANNYQSSSLLPLGEHKNIFPSINYSGVINVQQITLNKFINDHGNIIPDLLYIDVQGAEYKVLSGISHEKLCKIKVIYTEVSLVEMYQGAKLLDDIKVLLEDYFEFIGFRDMLNTKVHGDALFVNKMLLSDLACNRFDETLDINEMELGLRNNLSQINELFKSGQRHSAILAIDGLITKNPSHLALINTKAEFQYQMGKDLVYESIATWSSLARENSANEFYINKVDNARKEIYQLSVDTSSNSVNLTTNVNEPNLENNPLISVIVSTYASEAFIAECLDDLISQTVFPIMEIVIVDANSPENEQDVVAGYQEKYKNIRYIRTPTKIGIYAAWNLAIKNSKGYYITPMSTNDRLRVDAYEILLNAFREVNNDVMLIYGDSKLTPKPHETYYNHTHGGSFLWPEYCFDDLLSNCRVGPHPMWRKSVHDAIGYFDETFIAIGDQDFWIRIGEKFNLKHINEYTGLFWCTTGSLSGNGSIARHEINRIRAKYNNKEFPAYKVWKIKHALVEADGQILAEQMHTWKISPNFLILTVFESTNTALLADTIDSLNRQFHKQWSLAIISAMPSPNSIFDELEMVHWLQVDGDPYQAINQVLANVDAFDWVVIIPPGTIFSENALSIVSNYINKKPEWCFIYSDEDLIDGNDAFIDPLFKPDFNLELLRSTSYIGDACFVRKSVIDELGGYCGLAGVLNWDLSFKVFERLGASALGHVTEVLLHRPVPAISEAEQQYLLAAEKLTVQRHLERLEIKADVADGLVPNTYFVDYPIASKPFVSIVLTITNAEQLGWVNECIMALAKNTEYGNYEIVLTSQLPKSEVLKVVGNVYLADIPIDFKPFQGDLISPLSNRAIHTIKGDYVLLFSPDLTVLHQHWLETLMAQGLRDEVGIVGARIVDTDKNIHHAGIVLGMGDFGVADYPNRNLPINQPGYMNRAAVVQNFSAVSTQCFLVKKHLLLELPVNAKANVFDHIEFCLTVRQKGYAIVWTPFVTLMLSHQVLQERTMDQMRSDADQVIKNWLPQLANDPAYNRNLSLKHRHFQIETETDVTWNVDFHDRPRVYAFPANDSGVGEYRVRSPLRVLSHAALIQSSLLPNHSATLIPDVVEIERVKPDVLFLQNGTADYLLHAWSQYRKFNNVFMIYSQDDLVFALPGKHPLQGKWPKDMRKRLRKVMEHSDRLIVANEILKDAYSRWISDVKVVPNYLEKAKWLSLETKTQARNGHKLRVGWAGGGQHHGDLEFILPVVEATKDEVDWVFMGMCPDRIRPLIKEYHGGVVFDAYPQKLADLDLDLAIAPLEYNNFNMAKTNLRLLEYGILGWPVLCSDITPYKNAPVTRVANNVHQWTKALREKIHEPEALQKEGLILKQWVMDNYLLEDHLDEWLAALKP